MRQGAARAGIRQGIAQTLSVLASRREAERDHHLRPAAVTTDHQHERCRLQRTMTISGEGDFYNDADVQKLSRTTWRSSCQCQQLLTKPIQVQYRILMPPRAATSHSSQAAALCTEAGRGERSDHRSSAAPGAGEVLPRKLPIALWPSRSSR